MSGLSIRFSLLAAIGSAFFAAACDNSKDYLKGSLAEEYGLDFDDIRIRLYQSELSIEYLVDGEQEDKVNLRVTIENNALAQGKTYDLKTHGTVSRPDVETALPDLESGALDLDAFSPESGASVGGSFKAIFVTPEQNRLSLRGGFSGDLEVIKAKETP